MFSQLSNALRTGRSAHNAVIRPANRQSLNTSLSGRYGSSTSRPASLTAPNHNTNVQRLNPINIKSKGMYYGLNSAVSGPQSGMQEGIRRTSRPFVTVTKTTANQNPAQDAENTKASTPTQAINDANASIQQSNDAITITPSAIEHIHQLAVQKQPESPNQVYLRVYVDAGGCSGFQYKYELEHKQGEAGSTIDDAEDIVIDCVDPNSGNHACVVVDEGSLELLAGSTLDFVQEMIRSSFAIIDNPQSESACGCGSSFARKNFEMYKAVD